ncbi:carboxy terminal-processing peptidase [Cytophagaceae bacterium DM2B3-1]|uniref:Carboxy terminal-processing peptidase n=1 Tax=Xanthocytophaga flava TaxID=3048013 RepID=A0ABT7CUW4_9BACT|nr:carboxy terminal-processing peptidase [Xanthocytophaga flavus]MDJ1496419.1 carboxy terminal-processing peptidase [Xanthocytophaga flavus]
MIVKKSLLVLLPLLVGANFIYTQTFDNQPKTDLTPTSDQSKVSVLIAQILSQGHYQKTTLNDTLSSQLLDNYLKNLDYNRMYFLASDVQGFEKYRYQLDNDLKDGNLAAAYEIYQVYKNRALERDTYVAKLLEKEMDFTVDEYYETNREKASWAKNPNELNDLWRKNIKEQALRLKLNNKKWDEISKVVGERYKNIDKIISQTTSEDVFEAYMNAFAENIDPHTSYLSPARSANFKIDMTRSLEGIGASLREQNDYTTVTEVIPGGPAFKSKQVQKGDRIVAVAQGDDGKMVDVIGWRVDEVVKLIRGAKGTIVRLQLLSSNADVTAPPRELRLVRDKIKLEESSAKGEIVPITHNGKPFRLGVIQIPAFYANYEDRQKGETNYKSTTNDVKRIIGELQTQKMDALVLDLRNNGGGLLSEAIDLTGLFIPDGPVVQVRNSNGSIDVLKDNDKSQAYTGPLAVLINRFSASASEIFAGAIQDYKRGVIVGEQSYGKGTVQSQLDLNRYMQGTDKLGQVNLTIAKFYRVTGNSTQLKGVTPDVQLPSVFSAAEFGESSQPHALAWDQIPASNFKPVNNISEKLVSVLEKNYEKRLQSDADLKELQQQINDAQKARSNTKVSLQEAKRRKEREEAEKKNKMLAAAEEEVQDNPSDTEAASTNSEEPKKKLYNLKKDDYLKETTRLIADLLHAAK